MLFYIYPEIILFWFLIVHDGDYWRLLTPGKYQVTAYKSGYIPLSKVVSLLSRNRDNQATIINFDLMPNEDTENEVTITVDNVRQLIS